ncbi:pantoate--beta-alanine ligase [Roseiconus nitratireducens]|uniref:Pantothenate synthetase n=1 Tax=Roseiconus nitratireducens TaxID=2605748 RepID=A0A5M6DHX7_9BACT|nr:pantoate--beta-alanine ligase [Roseiconus nitratireducens]KAA5545850.1 pantoate--beta-alanine ligase [Roseiconus nitratireducens]
MKTLDNIDQARFFVTRLRRDQQTVGLVPTMGALHEGHLSLVAESVQKCDRTVATIFVNPTQFSPGEDLDKYPRTLAEDLRFLEAAGADAVFLPSTETMYPPGFSTMVRPPRVSEPLEGRHRPTHFEGVATVVLKLFNIVPASDAFFGLKDYQQYRVIEAMVRDFNLPIVLHGCEIVREPDGLAMSSRNRYLDPDQRVRARCVPRALRAAEQALSAGERDAEAINRKMQAILDGDDDSEGVDAIDYAMLADPITLEPLKTVGDHAVALIAAHVGTTRLIDNLRWKVPEEDDSQPATPTAKPLSE